MSKPQNSNSLPLDDDQQPSNKLTPEQEKRLIQIYNMLIEDPKVFYDMLLTFQGMQMRYLLSDDIANLQP